MLTVLPASALPLKVGERLFELEPATGAVRVGGRGAVTSTKKCRTSATGESLPAESVAMAVASWPPSLRLDEVHDQAPTPSVVAVQTWLPSTLALTTLLASAVPLNVGVRRPTTWFCVGDEMVGLAGAMVSTVKGRSGVVCALLPAASVATADALWLPCVRALETQLHVPAPFAVVAHTSLPSTSRRIAAPASEVPLKVGVVVASCAFDDGAVSATDRSDGVDGESAARGRAEQALKERGGCGGGCSLSQRCGRRA